MLISREFMSDHDVWMLDPFFRAYSSRIIQMRKPTLLVMKKEHG